MLKQIRKGLYQGYRQTHGKSPHHGKGNNKTYRDWYTIHARGDSTKGILTIGSINTPKDIIGKKIEIYIKVKEWVQTIIQTVQNVKE